MQTVNQRKYNEYVEEVREAVERKLGGKVVVQKVNKNNGLVLDGLTVMTEGVNLSPTIYLNGYYEDYISDGAVEVAKRIITIYEANKPKESIDISFFTDIEKVKPTIKMKLINYEKNKELLAQIPYAHSQGADGTLGWCWIYYTGQGAGDQESYAVYMKEGSSRYGEVFHLGDYLPGGDFFVGANVKEMGIADNRKLMRKANNGEIEGGTITQDEDGKIHIVIE